MEEQVIKEIEIPSYFLCPISLHLMVDPVIVSSGITYDRPSIEHWLRHKPTKKTSLFCPVTKQPLSAAELTPNHTLRRLIHSWSTLHSFPLTPVTPSSENIDDLIRRFTSLLSDHSKLITSIKHLKSLYAAAGPTTLASAEPGLFSEVVGLLRGHGRVPNEGLKWALKLLFEVNPWGRNRVKAVNAGATEAVIEILLDGGATGRKRVCEMAMAVLDQLCGCAEGRAGLVGHAAGLAVVSKRILRVSSPVSEKAVKILGAVSRNAANGGVLGEMAEVGVVAKLCLVVQVDCSVKMKERAKEILRAHSRVWKNLPCIPSHLLSSYPR